MYCAIGKKTSSDHDNGVMDYRYKIIDIIDIFYWSTTQVLVTKRFLPKVELKIQYDITLKCAFLEVRLVREKLSSMQKGLGFKTQYFRSQKSKRCRKSSKRFSQRVKLFNNNHNKRILIPLYVCVFIM